MGEDLNHLDVRYVPVDAASGTWGFFKSVVSEIVSGQYHLIHSHGFTAGVCCALPARMLGARHIMTSHDVINEGQFLGIKGAIAKNGISYALRMIDMIHCVGNDAKSNLLSNFTSLNGDRCVVIENGIEVERFVQASPIDFRGKLSLEKSVFLIGFLGRFMSQKGFRYLVDAVEMLRKRSSLDRKLLVLCFGDDGFVREEKLEVQRRGVADCFAFMPFVPNVAGTIKGLDVIVMPSLWEACGLLAMETLVCGVPLIATDCPGLREVIDGAPAIKVPTRNGEAIADALEQLMKVDMRKSFQDYAEDAAARFDVSIQRKMLAELYGGLMAGDALHPGGRRVI